MYDIKQFGVIPPPYGGVSVYVSRLIQKLREDGFVVGGYYSSDNNDNSLKDDILFNEWTWMETSKYPIKIWKYLLETRNYRIVHSHFGLEGMIYLWTLKTLLRKKIVITVHNTMVSNYFEKTNGINLFFLKKMLASNVEWIAVSEQGKQQMLELPITIKNEIHVIPPYIPDIEKEPLSSRMQSYINSYDKTIAFYGHSFMMHNGEDVYGFRTALEVYAQLLNDDSKVGLIFCLADNREVIKIEKLHAYAKLLGVDDKIFWQIGAIKNIQALWRQVNVYFRPTSTDGDSLAVREALDAGANVVVSDVVNRPESVLTYKYGNVEDAVLKIKEALALKRTPHSPNKSYYMEMKNLYEKLLYSSVS